MDFEKLGLFYLGREVDAASKEKTDNLLLYDAKDLTTHAMCVGMTGSGKTGLCVSLLEEAAMDRIPAIVVDPKGDMTNLLLSFPDMAPKDFEPWVREEDARTKGITVSELAAGQAETWRKGLADWGIDPQRIRTMRETTEFSIYTPGSSAGRPLSILQLLRPPSAQVLADSELLAEQISGTVSGLLSLIGMNADPLQSKDHILIANILQKSWRDEQMLDLPQMIAAIQTPPFNRVGVMELEDFFPEKERFDLALRFNNLLASPQFANWLEGESLDIDSLLHTETGKPRISILSISHLNDNERMFFVSLLLNQLVSWMRSQPGTSSLRAIFYMDEIFGYFPPVANPPSKQPLLTLLKQARAYGLGIVLTTQNPVDLDYKGLANMGTWFIGRLQTERDKGRLLDGLEGAAAAAGSAFDRRSMDTLISGLGKRIFLMNNVHEAQPTLFESRWAMSYLTGPLMRNQIRELSAQEDAAGEQEDNLAQAAAQAAAGKDKPAAESVAEETGSDSGAAFAASDSGVVPAASDATAKIAEDSLQSDKMPPAVSVAATEDDLLVSAPKAPPGITTYYIRANEGEVLRPAIFGLAEVHFEDKKNLISASREENWLTPLQEGLVSVNWALREDLDIQDSDLKTQAPREALYVALPEAAQKKTSFTQWERDLKDVIYRQSKLELYHHKDSKLVSQPDEPLRDFKIRFEQKQRELRDEAVEDLRDDYNTRILKAEEKIRKQEQTVEREEDQAKDAKMQTAISVGSTLLGALLGRKKLSTSTLGRATTAAKSSSRSRRQSTDVSRAEESLQTYKDELQALETQLESEIELLQKKFNLDYDEIETIEIAPKKTDIRLKAFALVFMPENLLQT